MKKMVKKVLTLIGLLATILCVALAFLCFNLNTKYKSYFGKVESYELAELPSIGGKSFETKKEYYDFLVSEDFCQKHKIKFDNAEVKLHYALEPDTKENLLPVAGDYSNSLYELSHIEKCENDFKIFFAIPCKLIGGQEFNSTRIVYVKLSEIRGELSGDQFKSAEARFITIK